MEKISPSTRETSFQLVSRTLSEAIEVLSGPLEPSSKIQSTKNSDKHWDSIRRESRENYTTNACQSYKLCKMDALKLLLMMNPKPFSKKWLETTTDTSLNLPMPTSLRKSRTALFKDTPKLTNYQRAWMPATQSDLDLLSTTQFSSMKCWTTTRKPVNLVKWHWLKPSRISTMLMKRPSEMPNQSLSSSKRTSAFGRKKMATTLLKTSEHAQDHIMWSVDIWKDSFLFPNIELNESSPLKNDFKIQIYNDLFNHFFIWFHYIDSL